MYTHIWMYVCDVCVCVYQLTIRKYMNFIYADHILTKLVTQKSLECFIIKFSSTIGNQISETAPLWTSLLTQSI